MLFSRKLAHGAAVVAGVAALVAGCASANPTVEASKATSPPGGASTSLAVIAGASSVAVVDGSSKVMDVQGVRSPVGAVRLGDSFVVQADEELVKVTPSSRAVNRRPCKSCMGLVANGDRLYSIRPDFTLVELDDELNITTLRPVTRPVETDPPRDPVEDPYPHVVGTIDGHVVVLSLTASGSARIGPSLVAAYNGDGTLWRSWVLNGAVFRSTTDTAGRRMAFGVGGSASACESTSVPVVVDPSRDQPLELVTKGTNEQPDKGGYAATDLWWNGDGLIAVGTYAKGDPAHCATEHAFRRFGVDGTSRSDTIRGLRAYRVTSAQCDRALLVDGSDERSKVVAIADGKRTEMPAYTEILWTEPRTSACTTFPGVDR